MHIKEVTDFCPRGTSHLISDRWIGGMEQYHFQSLQKRQHLSALIINFNIRPSLGCKTEVNMAKLKTAI